MNTPDDKAGRLTEVAMSRWIARLERRKEPRPNTAVYNSAYEAVYETLREAVEEAERILEDYSL